MIHARKDYNNRIQDNANIIPVNEPVFLLRGQDILAPDLLRRYAEQLQEQCPEKEEMIHAVVEHGDAMEEWQRTINVKIPDMPEGESIYSED